MKVAVVFIGTDKYLKFLPTWYESCEELLIPGIDKQYFIFTDGELEGTPDNMSVYPQEHLPWPYITLFRFGTILKAKEELEKYDWVLFLDADMRVVNVVTEDDLFTSKSYIGVHHPCHYMQMPPHNEFPGAFETEQQSTAGIEATDDISVYFQGCLWGGSVPEVLGMMTELQLRTQKDLEDGIIAKWHDESQMNKFFAQRRSKVHVLHPAFAFPEDFANQCQFEPKIVHLSKDNSKYHQ